MDKIKITSEELSKVSVSPPVPEPSVSQQEQIKTRLIPVWLRIVSALLVIFPPLLYIITVIVLPSIRKRPMPIKHAWAIHLCSLLVASGLLWLVFGMFIALSAPRPAGPEQSVALTISSFPSLPSAAQLTARDIAQELRPLVLVVHSQPSRLPFFRNRFFPTRTGAAAVIHADENGCLAVTSRHVVQQGIKQARLGQAIVVADEDGTWVSGRLVGRHRDLDLALISFNGAASTNVYTQPIRRFASIELGDNVFAIGHPQGLEFSISTGIISQKRGDDLLQVSAPVSPGSSGGPVYDQHGALLGIVESVIDKETSPNAENLNFAVRADALLDSAAWALDAAGEKVMKSLAQASLDSSNVSETPTQPDPVKE
ncbi:MAG: serine protease [Kiritimatiellia bacterium]|nr:serine protease [Kiritimatiellia bacterium]